MAEETCPSCAGSGGTDRVHYEIVTNPDGTTDSTERHTYEQCSYCGGSGRVAG